MVEPHDTPPFSTSLFNLDGDDVLLLQLERHLVDGIQGRLAACPDRATRGVAVVGDRRLDRSFGSRDDRLDVGFGRADSRARGVGLCRDVPFQVGLQIGRDVRDLCRGGLGLETNPGHDERRDDESDHHDAAQPGEEPTDGQRVVGRDDLLLDDRLHHHGVALIDDPRGARGAHDGVVDVGDQRVVHGGDVVGDAHHGSSGGGEIDDTEVGDDLFDRVHVILLETCPVQMGWLPLTERKGETGTVTHFYPAPGEGISTLKR